MVNHLIKYSDIRDKVRIVTFLDNIAPEYKNDFLIKHNHKVKLEELYDNIPRDVFIAYSSVDEETAKKVVYKLENEGEECWASYRNIRPNDFKNYWNSIENAIKNCTLFVLDKEGLSFVGFDNEGRTHFEEDFSASSPLLEYMRLRRGRPFVLENVESDRDSFTRVKLEDFARTV